jgi:hypothetical protein
MTRKQGFMVLAAALLVVQASLPAWGQPGQTGVSAPPADPRHPLARALDNNAHVWFVADLLPNNRQLLDILTVARMARQVMTQYEQGLAQDLAAAAPLFQQEIQSFSQGDTVPAQTEAGLKAFRQQRAQRRIRMLAAMDAQVRQMRRALAPEQVRMVDWTPPPEAATQGRDQTLLEELRQMNAELGEAERLIERIRYLIASDYITSRIGRIDEYLRQYVRPNTPEFEDARNFMLGLMDEVRRVPEEGWPMQASFYAGRVLQYLGVLDPPQRQTNAAYDWWDAYNLLTDPQTPAMLQQMLAVRGNPAGG